ncbi:MAG TPA: TIGR03560 family F420-dependent LLM class oxidoreductase [Gaiellaceae bacterium]|nr:TIGR03560 family F420-dependent LLM class oxidoreductase [Gaiellaceae bacterium]
MRVALMIEGQEGVSWDEWLALAQACEEHGIETLFRSDHYLSGSHPHERAAHDAWSTLAGLAARTARLRLGSLVSPVTFRHPSLLANAVSTVDHISGGRVELGMGAGWMREEHEAFGFPFPPLRERVEMLREQIEIVHRLWTEDHVTFEGEHYRLRDCSALPKPLQEPHPRILVGGSAKPGTAIPAALFADEYNTPAATPDECRERRRALDDACENVGRDPKTLAMSVMTGFVLGENDEELLENTRRILERWGSDLSPAEGLARYKSRGLAGTPGQLVEGLKRLEEAGVERVMLQHIAHDDLQTVALIGREVAPKL